MSTRFTKLGRISVLKARMNLFDNGTLRVKVNGVDVFKPQTGEVVSDGADGIACWFLDTDHDEESFFVRHA
jgi:adenine-specific DNA-methyltransferase